MKSPFFTVFTPVYNGEKHIHRVFESISNQIFNNFEWIVVDDGSVDNTSSLIREFIAIHPEIAIIYIHQANAGKHIAFNKAVGLARGVLFLPADADDSFVPETLSFFHDAWTNLQPEERIEFSGINVLCYDNNSLKILGSEFPRDRLVTNNLELEFRYKIKGEKWGCIRTDLLKERPFPIMKGSYFPESYLWLDLAKHFKVVCFNKPLRHYFTTNTGITQTQSNQALLEKFNSVQSRITIRYNLWLTRNFGYYILLHSPRVFFRTQVYTIKQIIAYFGSGVIKVIKNRRFIQ